MENGKFLLVWNINEYPECGGGVDFELFSSLDEMTDAVNGLQAKYDETFEIKFAGQIKEEIAFIPVEKITKLEPKGY